MYTYLCLLTFKDSMSKVHHHRGTLVPMNCKGNTDIGSELYINRAGGNEGAIKSEHLTQAGNLMTMCVIQLANSSFPNLDKIFKPIFL